MRAAGGVEEGTESLRRLQACGPSGSGGGVERKAQRRRAACDTDATGRGSARRNRGQVGQVGRLGFGLLGSRKGRTDLAFRLSMAQSGDDCAPELGQLRGGNTGAWTQTAGLDA